MSVDGPVPVSNASTPKFINKVPSVCHYRLPSGQDMMCDIVLQQTVAGTGLCH